jgi:hypothetical protein
VSRGVFIGRVYLSHARYLVLAFIAHLNMESFYRAYGPVVISEGDPSLPLSTLLRPCSSSCLRVREFPLEAPSRSGDPAAALGGLPSPLAIRPCPPLGVPHLALQVARPRRPCEGRLVGQRGEGGPHADRQKGSRRPARRNRSAGGGFPLVCIR